MYHHCLGPVPSKYAYALALLHILREATLKLDYIKLFIVGYSIRRLTKANKEKKYSIFGKKLAILIIKGIWIIEG